MQTDDARSWFLPRMWTKWRNSLIGRLLGESFKSQGKLYAISMTAMIVMASTAAGTAWIMEKIVDVMTDPNDRGAVFWVAYMVIGLFTVRGISSYLQAYFLARAGNRVVAMQQDRLYRKLLKHGIGFYRSMESSDLLTRFTRGAEAARALVDTLVVGFVRDLFTMLGLLAVMIYQQPTLSLICLVVGPLAVVGVRFLLGKVQEIMKAEMTSMAEIVKVIQETSTGIEVVKVFGLEKIMKKRMSGAIKQVETRSNAIKRLQAITSPLMDILAGFAIAGVLVVSAIGLGATEPVTAGQLLSFVTALLMTYEPAKRVSRMRVTIESQMVGVGMLFDLLDREDPMIEAGDKEPLRRGNGRIEFRDVTYSYRTQFPVIKDLSVIFEPGKMTALVGQSGGGKSTIAGLIMRFFDPDEGQILINGQSLTDVTLESLYEKMSYVGQSTFLFSNSVMENLRCSKPDASNEEVITAAKAAYAHDFIEALPNGYDTPIGENGAFLSGGQKQRIAIARAILRQAEILLLDEATSALDAESEAYVKSALQELTRDRTTIVIAHRLSTVMEADTILVIEAGRVIEQGAPNELRTRKNGAFQKLFEQQL